MTTLNKPMRPLERQLRVVGAALTGAKYVGDAEGIAQFSAKMDELLDMKLNERKVHATFPEPTQYGFVEAQRL